MELKQLETDVDNCGNVLLRIKKEMTMQFEVPRGINQQEIETAISQKYADSKFDWRHDNDRLILVIESNAVRKDIKDIIDLMIAGAKKPKDEQKTSIKEVGPNAIDFNQVFEKFASQIVDEAKKATQQISEDSEKIVLKAKKDLEDEGLEQVAKVEEIGKSIEEKFSLLEKSVVDANRKIEILVGSLVKIGSFAEELRSQFETVDSEA